MSDDGPYPSIDVALEEARRRYDDEERRRDSIDTKITGLLALDAVIVSIVAIGSDASAIAPRWQVVSIAFVLGSIVVVINQLGGTEYERPVKHLSMFSGAADDPSIDVKGQFLNQYVGSIQTNRATNDSRFDLLRLGIALTGLGLAVFLLASLGVLDLLAACVAAPGLSGG